MNEEILYYLWNFQKFNARDLLTTDDKVVTVLHPGYRNMHSGPDFLESKIRIDGMEWHGHVEIHINSSDWNRHGHQHDEAYNNVVLHVVWQDDKPVVIDNQFVPTIELRGRVLPEILSKAESLLSNIQMIPCSNLPVNWSGIETHSMIEFASIQRLERKSRQILNDLEGLTGDWEETFYRKLASNFGFKVNQEPFYQLASLLPHNIIVKNSGRISQLEALLFGTAGFLSSEAEDQYQANLSEEYKFLKLKYRLHPMRNPGWKFLRMRPANFPTVRLAQFAALYHKHPNLLRKVLDTSDLNDLKRLFLVELSPYWEEHYLFGKAVRPKSSRMGIASINLILINTVIPFLFSYGKLHDYIHYTERALNFLTLIKPEKNIITTNWEHKGITMYSAFEAQGSIELFQNFCHQKKCLQCKIGIKFLEEGYGEKSYA